MNRPVLYCVLLGLAFSSLGRWSAPPAAGQNAAAQKPAAAGEAKRPDALAALERKLLGKWYGPACGGDYTFNADGTYSAENFTPGQNNLTGTWSIRWDALPPTFIMTCKTTDFKTRDGTRDEYEYLGKPVEAKILALNDEEFAYRRAVDVPGYEWHLVRDHEQGGYTKPVK